MSYVFFVLTVKLGIDPNDLLIELLLSGIDFNDPVELLAFADALLSAGDVLDNCTNPGDECILAEYSNISLFGTVCVPRGCREEYVPQNVPALEEPVLFVCNTTQCNAECGTPSNCLSDIMSPVRLNGSLNSSELVPANEVCFVEPVIRYSYTGLINTSAVHAAPILMNAMNVALLRHTLSLFNSSLASNATITLSTHPL